MSGKYKLIFAIWFMSLVNYAERVVIGFAGPSMMHSLHIEPKQFGLVLSSFAFGYFLSQLPGGLIGDRWGARLVLVVGPILWALLTGTTGLMASVASLVALRFCFGVAEGVSIASMYKVVGDTYQWGSRAKALAIWGSAFGVAPAITGPTVAYLLSIFSWQSVFAILAIPALIVAGLNYAFIADADKGPSPGKNFRTEQDSPASLRRLLREPSIWLIGGAYCFWNMAFWGFLGWMPSYLAMERHIDIKAAGLLGGIPYLLAVFGVVLTGWLGSGVFHRHRVSLLAATYLLSGASLYAAYMAGDLTSCLLGLSGTAFFIYAGLSAYGMVVLDLAPAGSRGAYSGIVSTIGQLGSITAPVIIGYLVSATGLFASGFIFMILALGAAAAFATGLALLSSAREGRSGTTMALEER